MKNSWKTALITANVIILSLIIGICYGYVNTVQQKREEDTKDTFVNMVAALRKTASGYLTSHQQSCDDWARYISSHDMTLDEVMYFLDSANSIDGVMAHVIEYDTMKGLSTSPDSEGLYTVDYSDYRNELDDVIHSILNRNTGIFITPSYINPIDNKETIGFCRDIELTKGEHCLLIRTVPITYITENWVFPSDYKDAEITLMCRNGDYIIRSDSMKDENFWEFIRENNIITPERRASLQAAVKKDGIFFFEALTNETDYGYFVIMSSPKNENWYYTGYVPKESVIKNDVDFTMVAIVSVGFLILVILNCIYFFSVNKQLRDSADETRRANDAKTQFLSSMSHDIRTPMNAIIGITALSEKHITDPEYIKESLKKITLASNHLLTLINDILDISKVESGKLTMNPTTFSIAESITNVINIVRPQIKEKNQNFNIYINKVDCEYLFADQLRLNQIFINLLTNAVKYTPDDGTISVELRETSAENYRNVILTYIVSDNGIGMTKEFQATMYETFSRAADSRIDKIQGSGLGLAITKQMVDLMGGTIECESELKKGTTFIVTIELPKAENREEKSLSLPPMKILVVDDDEIFLETAADTLESMGAEVDTASDGAVAVEQAEKMHGQNTDYQLLIVDWKMPGIDGIETIRRMKKSLGNNVPIIVVSAYDWSDIEEEAVASGASGFISKPFFRSTIHKKIMEMLKHESVAETSEEDESDEFAGLHLLVAEDNDLNWEIISEILSNFDITADRAENGYICTQMAQNNIYDAIFMDIQMPVMNGREATKAIRRLDDERVKHIPIIAMTADAFAEDIQACLEAGMNGHIAKPIEINKIFEELRKTGLSRK